MDLQEVGREAWTGLIGKRQLAGTCKCGNETSGSIRRGEFLD